MFHLRRPRLNQTRLSGCVLMVSSRAQKVAEKVREFFSRFERDERNVWSIQQTNLVSKNSPKSSKTGSEVQNLAKLAKVHFHGENIDQAKCNG